LSIKYYELLRVHNQLILIWLALMIITINL
jgi:hypothetical protein